MVVSSKTTAHVLCSSDTRYVGLGRSLSLPSHPRLPVLISVEYPSAPLSLPRIQITIASRAYLLPLNMPRHCYSQMNI